jgi:hypothetical protein
VQEVAVLQVAAELAVELRAPRGARDFLRRGRVRRSEDGQQIDAEREADGQRDSMRARKQE